MLICPWKIWLWSWQSYWQCKQSFRPHCSGYTFLTDAFTRNFSSCETDQDQTLGPTKDISSCYLRGWGFVPSTRSTTVPEGDTRVRKSGANETQPLLISFKKPFASVSSATIARWIKVVLEQSGIDTKAFTAHSTGSASTSAAKAQGVSLAEVLSIAEWSRSSTFERFYRRIPMLLTLRQFWVARKCRIFRPVRS